MPDEYEQRRPYQEDGHLAVPDCTCPLKWPPEHLPECPSFGAPQEPRTGGVAVYRFENSLLVAFVPGKADSAQSVDGIWRPLAEAEALIDPNDPAVRERLIRAMGSSFALGLPPSLAADAVLAALRGAK